MEKDALQRTKEEIEAEKRDQRTVEQLLQDLGAGWSISLSRIRPSWCKGWLETIDTTPGEKLDMDYIADTWGGETIRLRILDNRGMYKAGKDVHVAREPMRHGRPLEHPDDKRARVAREEKQLEKREREEELARLNATQPNQDNGSVMKLFVDILKDSNSTSAQFYDRMADIQKRDPMGIEDIIKFANGIKDLQGVFGGGGDQAGADETNLLGSFMKIMDNVSERDKQKDKLRALAIREHRESRKSGAKVHSLKPHQTGRQQNPTPENKPTTPAPPVAPQPDPDETEELALSEEIAELEAVEAAEVLGEAFTMMPIEKRQKTIKLLLALANGGNAIDIATDALSESEEESEEEEPFKPSGTET